ncbi:hypothetical protein EXE58_08955 [Nocardioides seonyuensis]|uniref:phospholipase D n=1 Tax=Nocardioides seonyuensis TaxID=2518371 RepID=A0A4P7IEJ7_9ACTN|nr:phospholipase D-like domain-containing protein [Nocardioides seonyuensis]QBX55568.1 hypothetical protein EXE58_08955 [Nocardioides seonyuensis]
MTRSSTLALALWMALTLGLGVLPAASASGAGIGTASPAQVAARPMAQPLAQPAALRLDKPRRRKWRAPRGPVFNDPHLKKGHFRIERKLIKTINHAPRRSTIRIAVYSFDRMPLANALVAAHKRGVKIQMLLNDHWNTPAMKKVRNAIGAKRGTKNFIYKCKSSCRGNANEYTNMHSKLYLFSRAGKSNDVIAVGSHNLTRNADIHQWNDLYFTHGDHKLFREFVDLFNDMRVDYNVRQPSRFFCGDPLAAACDDSVDKHTALIYPKISRPKDDVVLETLKKVQCKIPKAGGGFTRSRLVLSMHTMRGNRGNYLAEAIRKKYAQGCDVRVMYGLIGYHTKGVLGTPTPRGRIPLRSTGLDFNPDDDFDLNGDGDDDLILSFYSHQKYLVVRGMYNGVPDTHLTVTGTANWASLSPGNDEVRFTVRGPVVAKKYMRNFNYQWRNQRNSRNAYTTSYVNFPGSPRGTTRSTR